MPTEKEVMLVQKATVYDLLCIFKEHPEKTFTPEELERILNAYIRGLEQ